MGWAVLAGCVITVGPGSLEIEPGELPAGVEGQPYEQFLSLNGAAAIRWRLIEGGLPSGISLGGSDGVLTGVPDEDGVFAFRVRAESVAGNVERSYTLTIKQRLRLSALFGPARVGQFYEATPGITGGVGPYEVEVLGLPGGLDYDRATGRIFGTPLNASSGLLLEFRIRDSDQPAQSLTERLTIVIQPLPVLIATEVLPTGTRGRTYSTTLAAENGRPPYRWTVVAGVLPAGLRLNPTTGVIFSEPVVGGSAETRTFTVEVEDADSPRSQFRREFTIEIVDG